jgi:mycothiol synthase
MIRRKYQNLNDQQLIRHFLQEVYLLNGRREYSWPLYRWDYWCWHVNAYIHRFDLGAAVFIWQDEHDHLVGVLNPENPGEAILQVHPRFRSAALEVEMISTAETQYAVTQPDGQQQLTIWCPAEDHLRQDILTRRGYTRQASPEFQHRRESALRVTAAPPPAGYSIRSLGGIEELPARSWLSWKACHAAEPESNYQGWEWYQNVQKAPLYRHDLDLVAIASDGEMAAFCTLWYDAVACSAAIEPVGVHPDHRRRGLGKALLTEGLHRAYTIGATLVTVGSYDAIASALYASVGFTEYDLCETWMKVL